MRILNNDKPCVQGFKESLLQLIVGQRLKVCAAM